MSVSHRCPDCTAALSGFESLIEVAHETGIDPNEAQCLGQPQPLLGPFQEGHGLPTVLDALPKPSREDALAGEDVVGLTHGCFVATASCYFDGLCGKRCREFVLTQMVVGMREPEVVRTGHARILQSLHAAFLLK